MQKFINEHLNKIETSLKKAPFWKYATIATVCIEQEYAIYETLAKGCAYDMSKFLGKVIKRYWQAIPTGYSIDESFLLAIEESIFSPRDEWLLHSTPEQWVTKIWEELGTGGAFYTNYVEKKLPELCDMMSYPEYAQRDYVKNRMPERVRGFWYLYAYSKLCMYELVEKGYELNEKSLVKSHMDWFADSTISAAMIYAYAAGAKDLIPRLARFAKGVHNEEPYTEVQDHIELFAGKNSEDLYQRVEQWEKSNYQKMILCILKGDAKEFRKALLQSVRHDRKEYDMSCSFFGPWAYTCVKLAKKYGIEVEPVNVVELLDWNFDETPIDCEVWKLPLQEDIDKWLKN